jgi:hypothetical protein
MRHSKTFVQSDHFRDSDISVESEARVHFDIVRRVNQPPSIMIRLAICEFLRHIQSDFSSKMWKLERDRKGIIGQ